MGIFPSVSLVKSLPVLGEQIKLERMSYDDIVKFNNERWFSGKQRQRSVHHNRLVCFLISYYTFIFTILIYLSILIIN